MSKSHFDEQSSIDISGKRSSIHNNSRSRKFSEDGGSIFLQEQSFMEKNQSYRFLYQEPQIPPKVVGNVRKCYKICSCLSSHLVMALNFESVSFFKGQQYNTEQPVQTIQTKDLKAIYSYRKKDSYFIRLTSKSQGKIDLRFSNKYICKEWIYYFNQAIQFQNYLTEKEHYYKKDSFKQFMNKLSFEIKQKVVKLQDSTIVKDQYDNRNYQEHQNTTIIKTKLSVVRLADFKVTHCIGKGAFSTVYKAQKNGKVYALKQMNKDQLLYRDQMKYALAQLKILVRCQQCPFIIPISYAFQTEDYLYFALKYYPFGTLKDLLEQKKTLNYREAFRILTQLIVAIEYLHKKNILYRDLKPQNILLDHDGHVILIDFGLSIELNQDQQFAESFVGTPLYLIPQRLEGVGKVNYKGDIYGVGCIFYLMLHGKVPFEGDNLESIIFNIKNNQVEIRNDIIGIAKNFLIQTLQKNPDKRLNYMSSHPLFEEVDWNKISNRKTEPILKMKEKASFEFVSVKSINDKDYTQENYPNKKVNDWNFTIKL